MARKNKLGKITMQVGAEPTESDIVVANVFARLGFGIEFILDLRKIARSQGKSARDEGGLAEGEVALATSREDRPLSAEISWSGDGGALGKSSIAPSRAYMVRTPDIRMDGLAWEIKCIESNKMDKVRRNISAALDQSENIIIGTFRTPILDDKIVRYITRRFTKIKKIKRLKVVTKTHQVLDIK